MSSLYIYIYIQNLFFILYLSYFVSFHLISRRIVFFLSWQEREVVVLVVLGVVKEVVVAVAVVVGIGTVIGAGPVRIAVVVAAVVAFVVFVS